MDPSRRDQLRPESHRQETTTEQFLLQRGSKAEQDIEVKSGLPLTVAGGTTLVGTLLGFPALVGHVVGGLIGGGIGTLFAPGVGTAAGAVVGAQVGAAGATAIGGGIGLYMLGKGGLRMLQSRR